MTKRVKVRDMQPGCTYTMPDTTIEELYEGRHDYSRWPPIGMEDAIPNTGLFLGMNKESNNYGKYGFSLYPVHETDEIVDRALHPGETGSWKIELTGNKVWTYNPNCSIWIEVESLDFEMEEAHSFPVAVVKDGEVIPLPNPWNWKKVPYDTEIKESIHVWDNSDIKTLISLGILSIVLLMAGLPGLTPLVLIWLIAIAYFYAKHEKTRADVIKEREKYGVRGNGLDHKFKW